MFHPNGKVTKHPLAAKYVHTYLRVIEFSLLYCSQTVSPVYTVCYTVARQCRLYTHCLHL